MLLAVTFESVLLVLTIVGVIVGLGIYRILLAKRRVAHWKRGLGPGHESFMELPYKRDQVFPMVNEILAGEYTVTSVARVERLLLGEKPLGKNRVDRVTVRVAPTLEGCEILFVRLGPGWKSLPKGSNGPEAERFFSALMARLGPISPPGVSQTKSAGPNLAASDPQGAPAQNPLSGQAIPGQPAADQPPAGQ